MTNWRSAETVVDLSEDDGARKTARLCFSESQRQIPGARTLAPTERSSSSNLGRLQPRAPASPADRTRR
jgi:hypothetical protein